MFVSAFHATTMSDLTDISLAAVSRQMLRRFSQRNRDRLMMAPKL